MGRFKKAILTCVIKNLICIKLIATLTKNFERIATLTKNFKSFDVESKKQIIKEMRENGLIIT